MNYYKRIDSFGKTNTVESYSHNSPVPGAIKITEKEFDAFIKNLPAITPIASRDIIQEFDTLKSKLKQKGLI
tara:strand:+ start:4423 stop:4638 length:216 start_codon:yes stop_codon:yes gene_type:complete